MITVIAKIKISNRGYLNDDILNYQFRCSILAKGTMYITETTTLDGADITINDEVLAEVKILYGEMDIYSFLPGKRFDYIVADKLGDGQVVELKEILLEKTDIEKMSDEIITEIFSVIDDNPHIIVNDI